MGVSKIRGPAGLDWFMKQTGIVHGVLVNEKNGKKTDTMIATIVQSSYQVLGRKKWRASLANLNWNPTTGNEKPTKYKDFNTLIEAQEAVIKELSSKGLVKNPAAKQREFAYPPVYC